MDAWVDIRRRARACHAKALAKANGDRHADKIIAAALQCDDLELRRINFDPGILGSLDRSSLLVNVAKGQEQIDERVVIAHEIGHFHLHHDPHNEVTARLPGLGGDPVDSGAGKVEGYSPRERKEVQADIFAGEFLCPGDWLRIQFVTQGKRPTAIAEELGLPVHLVMNQMIRALLLPPVGPAPVEPPHIVHDLDESQQAAVDWHKGPLLVDAGPGTGKTRTLVRRIKRLLDDGSLPSAFLALTFSNKAAEEMRERLSAMNAGAGIEMWVSTFHAFGLELVTKWPLRIKRSDKVRVLDQTGQLALLEANLEKLPLYHFQNLYEPAYELVPVLRVISRCKDELISPDEYEAAAKASAAEARTDEDQEHADRALEIAAIYRIYEQELERADAVDFGDLVRLAIELVKNHPEVQAHVKAFKHILIDEYQDVNFASAELLRVITNSGTDVWVVADQRQSIYRFRGAEPSNVSRFTEAFGGERHALANNYRSFAPIVSAFECFASSMGFSGGWKSIRGAGGAISLTVAPTLAAEGEAIAERIRALHKQGVSYGEQAVLARSHLTLARITGVLEKLGVPLLYLGDLFERAEIRDLLSLVGLDAELGGIGLVRLAGLPEYKIPKADALATIRWARENRQPIFESLKQADVIEGLTPAGRVGLLQLGIELNGLGKSSPWTLLTTWLFERSNYLNMILTGDPTVAQQQLVAIYQLLKVCGEQVAIGDPSRKRFLERIRRIEALNEDTAYRAISSEASDMDAVRVMTIHGSKGLEFNAVHLPAIATGYMPGSWRGIRIKPPPTLTRLAMQSDGHGAEEECLFFVALSRARDTLSLTRADRYTTRTASASKFLSTLGQSLPSRNFSGSGKTYLKELRLDPPSQKDVYPERDLEVYMKCPARYRYEVIDGLRGGRDEFAYVSFHRCVYQTVGWLEEERQKGNAIDVPSALGALARVWEKDGPNGHPFESYHRAAAERMVRCMAEAIVAESATYDRAEWSVSVGKRSILMTPDRVLINPDGSIRIQRIRTGRKTKSEPGKPIYGLLRRGAQQRYQGRRISIETFYLATGETVAIPQKDDDKLIAEYTDAIAGIERGAFEAVPEARTCPNCPSYFICGS